MTEKGHSSIPNLKTCWTGGPVQKIWISHSLWSRSSIRTRLDCKTFLQADIQSKSVSFTTWVHNIVPFSAPIYFTTQVLNMMMPFPYSCLIHDFFSCMNLSMHSTNRLRQCSWQAPPIYLTSIAGLVHVNDLDLTTQILVSPCHTCSLYTELVLHGKIKIWVVRSLDTSLWHIPNRCDMERPKSGS